MRALCLMLIILLSACSTSYIKGGQPINHIVLVWFDETVDDRYIHEVAIATQQLKRIPGILEIRTGRPIGSERPVVDDSFDLGVVVRFDTVEKMQSYVDDPVHKKFVENYLQGKIKKLIVYDF